MESNRDLEALFMKAVEVKGAVLDDAAGRVAQAAARTYGPRLQPKSSAAISPVMADNDIIDAKIEAAEARIDTKFAELRGDLKDFATKGTVWGAVATAIASILGVLLAVLAFGGDRFDGGLGLADQRQAQLQKDERQDEAANAIDAKLDLILAGQTSAKPAGDAKRP